MTVTDEILPTSINLKPYLQNDTKQLRPGVSFKIDAAVWPDNASDKTLTWTSDNESAATVDATGLVTTHATGTANITVSTKNNISETVTIVVTETIKPEEIIINHYSLQLKKDETFQLTATVNPRDADSTAVTWKSSSPEIATVDESGVVTAHKDGQTTITASIGEVTGFCTVTVTDRIQPTNIYLDRGYGQVKIGESIRLEAYVEPKNAEYDSLQWTSDNNAIATVAQDGTVTGVSEGKVTIRAEIPGTTLSNSCTIEVVEEFQPYYISLNTYVLQLNKGKTKEIYASVYPQNAPQTVSWQTSNANVATVEDGVVTAVGYGECYITAAAGTVSERCRVTVTDEIVPQTVYLHCMYSNFVKLGKTKQMTAEVLPEDVADKRVTWYTSNPAVAEVDENGLVSGKSKGRVTITAVTVLENISDSYDLEVTDAIYPSEMYIYPTFDEVAVGYSNNYDAYIYPYDADDPSITWSSSAPDVAEIDETTGRVTGKKTGTAVITAVTSNGLKDERTLTVTETPQPIGVGINSGDFKLKLGADYKLTATVYPEYCEQTVTWSSDKPSVVSVKQDGTLHGEGLGKARITASTANGKSSTIIVTVVNSVPVDCVYISSSYEQVAVNKTISLYAVVVPSHADNRNVSWQSSDTSIAEVDEDGVVTGKAAGEVTITVTTKDGGKSDSRKLTVTEKVLPDGIYLSRYKLQLLPGTTASLEADIYPGDAEDRTVTWSSDNEAVVQVNDGVLTAGENEGTAVITARTVNGKEASCTVTVTNVIHPESVWIDAFDVQIKPNAPREIEAVVVPDNAQNTDLIWSVDSPVLKLEQKDNKAIVTGLKEGKAYLYVKTADGEQTDSKLITVTKTIHPTGMGLSWGSGVIKVNRTTKITPLIQPEDADNQNVTYTSSDEKIATVSADGTVTGVAPGDVTITVETVDGHIKSEAKITVIAEVHPESISLYEHEIQLKPGSSRPLYFSLQPNDADYTDVRWSSSKESVATVNESGVVTAVAEGDAVITVTTVDGSYTDTCNVKVSNVIHPASVSIYGSTSCIKKGEMIFLYATVYPYDSDNRNVRWESEQPGVAEVDATFGYVTGVSAGTAVIKAITEDGNKTGEYEITVADVIQPESISLSLSRYVLKIGETAVMRGKVLPENADDREVVYYSNDPSIAEVDEHGIVTAKAEGTVRIGVRMKNGEPKQTETELHVVKEIMPEYLSI